MGNPEQPRGFERAQEMQRESYAEVADDYSSEVQARAAAQLVEVAAKHKKIDIALAERAKAMLREMIDTGGDVDLEAVRGLVDEAERRYAIEDATTEETAPGYRSDVDETTFFSVERRAEPVRQVEATPAIDPAWEHWRQHLLAVGGMDGDGDLRRDPAELGLTKEQADYISALQRHAYMSGGLREKEVRQVVEISPDNYTESAQRQQVRQMLQSEEQRRDAILRRPRTGRGEEAQRNARDLADVDARIAQLQQTI